jgi:hypothetical protein
VRKGSSGQKPQPPTKQEPSLDMVVEHDLSVLDYLSEFICVLYGQPTVWRRYVIPLRSSRHQHLPRRPHSHRELAIPRE